MSLISVIVPTYGRPDLLRRCLKSVNGQEYRDFEVLVADDSSPQEKEYAAVIESFAKCFPLRYWRNSKNSGPQIGRNWGIREAKGKYIAFLDDDDEWLPAKLGRQVALFESGGPNLGLVYSWVDALDDARACVYRYRSRLSGSDIRPLLDRCFLPSPSVAALRRALLAVGGWDETLTSCQDWDLWTRIVGTGFSYAVVEEVLALYNTHAGARIGNSARALEGFKSYYRKHRALYRMHDMSKTLSEKQRALAGLMRDRGDMAGALEMLHCSIRERPANWKAWVRFLQLKASRGPASGRGVTG